MRRRDKAGGKAGKAQHRKTLVRRDVHKAVRRRRRGSDTEPEPQVTQLRRELQEALQQQKIATADVLKVISSSPGELTPVFNAILQNAVRICDAKFAHLWLCEGYSLRIGGIYGGPDAFVAYLRDVPYSVENRRQAWGNC